MKRDSKSLIQLCADVISKNELFSKMISQRDKKIKHLEDENKRLHQLITAKNTEYQVLYDRLLDKGEEVKNLNDDMLDMAYKCNQRLLYA